MANEQQINVNYIPDFQKKQINCSQGDVGREFKVEIDNGENYQIPEGAIVEIAGKKSDGKIFSYVVDDVDDNVVTILTREQMTTTPGPVECEIRISKDNKIIGTANFILYVEGGVLDGYVSESEIDFIDRIRVELLAALARVEEAVDDARDYAEDAQEQATIAEQQADRAESAAQGIEQYVEDAQTAARNAQSSAQDAFTYSQDAEDSAEDASEAALQAGQSASNASSAAQSATDAAQSASQSAQNASQSASNASQSATDASSSATEAETAADRAEATLIVTEYIKTIAVADWDATTHIATVTVQGVTTTSVQEILPLLANNHANIQNNDALSDAVIYDAGQATDTIYLYAATIPSVDVSVRVIVHGGGSNA